MRESRTYGSVRGALSNERPYRDRSAIRDSCRELSPRISLRSIRATKMRELFDN